MKQVLAISILLLVCVAPLFADQYDVADMAYFIDGASFEFTNSTTPDIRGLCYNAVTNHIVISENSNGELAVLNPSDGSTDHIITNAGTGDASVSLFRVEVSEDGQLYTSGFGGTVRRIGPDSLTDAAASPVVIASASYPTTGACRALFVNGSYSAGTVSVLTSRGATVYLWRQQGAGSDVFALGNSFDTTGTYTGEPTGLWANDDLTVIMTQKSYQGAHKWTGSVGSGYAKDASFTPHSIISGRYSLDVDPEMDLMIGAGSSAGSYNMTMLATVRYATPEAIGGSVGNTAFWWNDGLWCYGGTTVPNGAGDCAIDSFNEQAYGVSGAGLIVLNLDVLSAIETWLQY